MFGKASAHSPGQGPSSSTNMQEAVVTAVHTVDTDNPLMTPDTKPLRHYTTQDSLTITKQS